MTPLALPLLLGAFAAVPAPIPWASLGQGPTVAAPGRLPTLIANRSGTTHAARFLRPEHAARLKRVNFGRRIVVIAHRTFPTCGYRVNVRRVLRMGRTIRVAALATPPPADTAVCQVFTTPYHAVTISRASLGSPLPARVAFSWTVARARA